MKPCLFSYVVYCLQRPSKLLKVVCLNAQTADVARAKVLEGTGCTMARRGLTGGRLLAICTSRNTNAVTILYQNTFKGRCWLSAELQGEDADGSEQSIQRHEQVTSSEENDLMMVA